MGAYMIGDLPSPDRTRGGGEPVWTAGMGGAAVSPVAPYNRADPEAPAVELIAVTAGQRTCGEARALGLALLAVAEYAERADEDGSW